MVGFDLKSPDIAAHSEVVAMSILSSYTVGSCLSDQYNLVTIELLQKDLSLPNH
jgi:hypothetical protein